MVKRILTGIVLTVVLLSLARRLSTRRPHEIAVDAADVRITHTTITEQVGPGKPVVAVNVAPAGAAEPCIVVKRGTDGERSVLPMVTHGGGTYEVILPDLGKGHRYYYAFEVAVAGGEILRIPSNADDFFFIKFKGDVSDLVLTLHIVFMFCAFFFMIQSLMGAVGIIRGREGKHPTVLSLRWCLLCTFIGGWPLGFVLNYQAFGVVWEGFPFGYDVTDNKTQLIFLFWLVTALLVRSSLFGRSESGDVLGPRGLALAVVLSFIVSLGLFILPHSL